jgi:hypothetical protein
MDESGRIRLEYTEGEEISLLCVFNTLISNLI